MNLHPRLPLLVLALVLGVAPLVAHAEDQVVVPVDEDSVRLLDRARRHADKEEWADAVETALRILDEKERRVVAVEVAVRLEPGRRPRNEVRRPGADDAAGGRRRYVGVEEFVWDFLGSLPPGGLAALKRRIDPLAHGLYQEGLADGDIRKLASLASRYPLAEDADDALVAAADLWLEAGDVSAADRLYRRLAESYPDSDRLGAQLTLRAAYAAGCARGRAAADELLGAMRRTAADEPVRLGLGSGEEGLRFDDAAARVLAALPARPVRDDQGMLGLGSARRNPVSDQPLNLGARLWTRDIASFEGRPESREIKWGQGGRIIKNTPGQAGQADEAYPYVPAVAGGTMYLSSNNRIVSYDLETGRPGVDFQRPNPTTFEDSNHVNTYAPVILDGRLYGNFITELLSGEDWRGFPIKVPIAIRDLFCYDLDTGKILWNLGGDERIRSRGKVRPSFPEPPLAVDGLLYLPATLMEGFVKGYVYCVDPATGRIVWKTWVVSGQVEATMFGYWAREPLCTMLAAEDGVIYYATSLGSVAALDASNGRILWISTYNPIPIVATSGYYPEHRVIPWRNNPPLVGRDMVFVAPLDADNLYGLDKRTGEVLCTFDPRFTEAGLRYMAGLHDGKLILTGDTVVALDVHTGRPARPYLEIAGANATGRPLIAGGMLHLPSRTRIHHIDLDRWRVVGETPLPEGTEPGSLFLGDGYAAIVSREVHPSEQARTGQAPRVHLYRNGSAGHPRPGPAGHPHPGPEPQDEGGPKPASGR